MQHAARRNCPAYAQPSKGVRRQEHRTDPAEHWVFGNVRRPAANVLGMMLRSPPEGEPEHVAPPGAIVRRMRIAFLIAMSMMLTVIGNPIDGGSFARQSADNGEQPTHRSIGRKAHVRKLAMKQQK